MKKKYLVMLAITLFTINGLYAEETATEERKISYNVALDVGSTYLWRALDTYSAHLNAGNPKSVFNFAPALFPSVTVSTDVGLLFNIWGAVALVDRTTADVNLQNADEIDLTASYSIEDKSGIFGASLIGYLYPTTSVIGAAAPSYAEIVFSYTAPVLLSPTASFAASMGPKGGEYEYASLGISHAIEAGILTITPKFLVGYWIMNNDASTNKLHFDINVPFAFAINDNFEFHAILTGCYRAIGFDEKYSPFLLVASVGASYSF